MNSFITIVSGLPRSGTSLLMKMLEAGGMTPLTDRLRAADVDNPNGYYEFERVKKLPLGDTAWLAEAEGKVVKIIAALIPYLPDDHAYRVIFTQRDIREVIASQNKMLEHRGVPPAVSDGELAGIFEKHLLQVDHWILTHPNISRLDVNYNELMHNPAPIADRLRLFLDLELDSVRMARVVDPSLYRQRAAAEGSHP